MLKPAPIRPLGLGKIVDELIKPTDCFLFCMTVLWKIELLRKEPSTTVWLFLDAGGDYKHEHSTE